MTGDSTSDRNGDLRPSQVRDLAGEAMRRRIAARLFGEEVDAVFLGRFRILETLGHGGMGIVYAAEDAQLDRRVAIKVIREDRMGDGPRERSRLLREARSLAKLSHPNVVQVYEVGEHDGGMFIVMELVRGTTLRAWLAAERRSLDEVLARFVEAGRGLAAAHRVGICHRDFKPANALVDEEGRVRIVDFGLARGDAHLAETAPERPVDVASTPSVTGAGSAIASTRTPAGTPGYIAPEQLLGAPGDARSDQYAFCVALFEAVYGRPPVDQTHMFPGAARGALVPADRRVPGWLRGVLARGLAVRPEDRHTSMATLIAALQELPRARRLLQLALAGAVVFTLALAVAMMIGGALLKPDEPDLCAASDQPIAGLWGEPQRVVIERGFTATGLPHAARTWKRVSAAIDAYAARWIAVRTGLCEARVHGRPLPRSYEDSVACLDDALLPLTGLVDALHTPDAEAVSEADTLVAWLPRPERCVEAGEWRHGEDDKGLRLLLERAEIAVRSGKGREAVALLSPLIAHLQTTGDRRSAEAAALLLLGKAEGRLLRRPARARRSLEAAYDRAAGSSRTDLLWEILNEQAWVSASERDAEAARRAWDRAAAMQLDSDDPVMKAALVSVESQVLLAEERHESAVQRARTAIELLAETPDHPGLPAARAALAAALGQADRIEEATALNRASLTELKGELGDEHPAAARVELNLGIDLLEAGRFDEARGHVAHARGVLLASHGRENPRVATADLALAQLDGMEGSLGQATERALAASAVFRESFGADSADRVTALVLLAQLYAAERRTRELLAVNRELLAIHESGVRHTSIDVPILLANIGDGLCELGLCADALPYFGQLLGMRGAAADPWTRALGLRGMGLVHRAQAEPTTALLYFDQALRLMQALPPSEEIDLFIVTTASETADTLVALRRDPGRVKALRRLAASIEARLAAP